MIPLIWMSRPSSEDPCTGCSHYRQWANYQRRTVNGRGYLANADSTSRGQLKKLSDHPLVRVEHSVLCLGQRVHFTGKLYLVVYNAYFFKGGNWLIAHVGRIIFWYIVMAYCNKLFIHIRIYVTSVAAKRGNSRMWQRQLSEFSEYGAMWANGIQCKRMRDGTAVQCIYVWNRHGSGGGTG